MTIGRAWRQGQLAVASSKATAFALLDTDTIFASAPLTYIA